ncbi:ABC transporter ATP-binding protein [Streptomyces luteogriseus]|uniref:ABC-type multidrug transport system fused ATPase/permease subunit n=1 Tax=Streptomyces luteogriseus TaxID=68233 RepID=A0A7W7DVJ3_9ACTN|nr:ABC transporter ATP-binding protein [Streptomyces luteogriseus]MBB4716760.1 ABC-type multidrug transport system fused ATPase/permease subunit [Streptomyces luteogriseus]
MTEGSDLPTRERRVPYTDPGTPDLRSPARYLWWLVRMQRGRILLGSLWGSLWMCALMLPPYFMAQAIDDGLRQRDTDTLTFWVVIILVTGAAIATLGILRHRTMTLIRTDAAYRTAQVVVRQVTRLGATLPRKVSVGELTHLQAGDMGRIAVTLTITGPGVGAVIAYAATAVLLFTISAVLAGVVLLGVPLLALAVGPLLGKLHGAEGTYRERQGELTARAGDIVSGLGVLCGIGGKAAFGKRYRQRSQALLTDGYRVASFTSWVQAIGAGLPVIFLAVVTWISARMAASGTITVGEMVAVYGYVAALLVPVSFFIEGADDLPRGLVAARRVVGILALEPDVEDGASPTAAPAGPAALCDPDSGLTLEPGRMTALVSARLDEARAVVDRLARYTDSDATWGGVRLSDLELAEVRRRVLVADNDAHLFAGALRSAVSVRDDHAADELQGALRAAVAEDIVEALPDGLDTRLEAQGRNVSGGQRQRVRLVRALLADPDVLLLVEPTSALDAHTEATVAQRVLEARRGRTTLVVSTSPLILDRAAQVSYLVDGAVVAVGTHGDLLATHPGYRDLVLRGSDESVPAAHTTALQEGTSR